MLDVYIVVPCEYKVELDQYVVGGGAQSEKMTLPKVRRALELIVKPKPASTLLFSPSRSLSPDLAAAGGIRSMAHLVEPASPSRSPRHHQILCTSSLTNIVRSMSVAIR